MYEVPKFRPEFENRSVNMNPRQHLVRQHPTWFWCMSRVTSMKNNQAAPIKYFIKSLKLAGEVHFMILPISKR